MESKKLTPLTEDFKTLGIEVEGLTEAKGAEGGSRIRVRPPLLGSSRRIGGGERLKLSERRESKTMEGRGLRKLDETRREFSRRVRRLGRFTEERLRRPDPTEKLVEELKSIGRLLGEQGEDTYRDGYKLSMLPTKQAIGSQYSGVSAEVARAFRNVSTLADILVARLEDISSELGEPEKKEIAGVVEALGRISEQAEEIVDKEKKPEEGEEDEKKEKAGELGESRFVNRSLKRNLIGMVEDLTKVTDYYLRLSGRDSR